MTTHTRTRTQLDFSIANFDLFDYIKNTANVDVAAQMAQGVAWKIDVMLQAASRELFKSVRQHLFGRDIDGLAELTIALRSTEYAGASFREAGSSTDGPVVLIGELMHFREAAHNMATELTSLTTDWNGRPVMYVTPDLDDVFHGQVNLKLKTLTRTRVTRNTTRRGEAFDLTKEEIAAHIARKLAVKEENLRQVGVTLEEQAGAVFEMYKLACASATRAPGESLAFYELGLNAQRAMIEHAATNAQRASDRAEDNSNLTDEEADEISMTATKVTKDMKLVLASPRFVIAQQVEDAY